jgi:uracil-DNA glycosylase family protein
MSRLGSMVDKPAEPRRRFKTLAGLNRALKQSPPIVGAGRVVTGEGPTNAAIAFVGEQPGDQEDVEGRPFVGPAGKVLDAAMEAAGIAREACYLTNAVKQFKFERRGKRRLHQRPTTGEVAHYRWWLDQELDLVKPALIVALGATAAFALTGKRKSIVSQRGRALLFGRPGYITVHPSSLLRIPDQDDRRRARRAFVADLKKVSALTGSARD